MRRVEVQRGLMLTAFVQDFATAVVTVDAKRPQGRSRRSGRLYHPGIGPLSEGEALVLILEEMKIKNPTAYSSFRLNARYPGSMMTCDLLGDDDLLVVEVKMARP